MCKIADASAAVHWPLLSIAAPDETDCQSKPHLEKNTPCKSTSKHMVAHARTFFHVCGWGCTKVHIRCTWRQPTGHMQSCACMCLLMPSKIVQSGPQTCKHMQGMCECEWSWKDVHPNNVQCHAPWCMHDQACEG